MSEVPLFFGTSGPTDGSALIAIVGEAWGAEEFHAKMPFVGGSGNLLNSMLKEAGYDRSRIFCTNVRTATPKGNEMYRFFYPRDDAPPDAMFRGLQPLPDTRADVERMHQQLRTLRPRLIICLGNYALWAVTNAARTKFSSKTPGGYPVEGGGRIQPTGIGDFRGSMLYSDVVGLESTAVLPLIHPAAIMREWSWKHTTANDMKRRIKQALTDDWIDKQKLSLLVLDTYEKAQGYLETTLANLDAGKILLRSCDIETYQKHIITCIGFGESKTFAATLPFVRRGGAFLESHWTIPQEVWLLKMLQRILCHPNIRLIGQNFLYDQYVIWKIWGFDIKCFFDTMLAMHLWLPGMPKDLGYLSSLMCHYHRYWKDDNKNWSGKIDMSTHLLYNAEDCCRTFEIFEVEDKVLDGAGHKKPFFGSKSRWEFMMRQNVMAFNMMKRGILTNRQRRGELVLSLTEAAAQRDARLQFLIPQALVGEPTKNAKKELVYWTDSSKQQMELFYNILEFPVQKNRKTKQPSLDRESLDRLYDLVPWASPIIVPLIEKRKLETFARFPSATVSAEGRMHCGFNPGGTETFRMSSSESPLGEGTNMQNNPKGTED